MTTLLLLLVVMTHEPAIAEIPASPDDAPAIAEEPEDLSLLV